MKQLGNIIRILFFILFVFLIVKGKPMLWLGLFLASLIFAVVFGRVYCGYMCPMNTLMIPVESLSKKLKLKKAREPKWLKNGYFTWITLIISILATLVLKIRFQITLPILPFWLFVSLLITLKYEPHVFHNLICPFASLQKTFGRLSRYSEKVNVNSCIGCKLCEKVCPSRAIIVSINNNKAFINNALCHQCKKCQYVCPTNAILYGRIKQ